MKEIYKDIKGYEGLYQVSNKGNVKSLKRTRKNHHGGIAPVREIILKADVSYQGYYRVSLCKEKVYKHFFVHRLVAEAFIPKEKNKEFVNHKDFNRKNNYVENLEWVTTRENCKYSAQNCKKAALNAKTPKTNEHYIYFKKDGKKNYCVSIRRSGKTKLKYCTSLKEAKRIRDAWLKEIGESKIWQKVKNY